MILTDDTILDWLARRVRGQSSDYIGRLYGVTSERVRVATNRVVAADEAESGEDVSRAYWDRTTGPRKRLPRRTAAPQPRKPSGQARTPEKSNSPSAGA